MARSGGPRATRAVEAGARIRVTAVDGLTLSVEAAGAAVHRWRLRNDRVAASVHRSLRALYLLSSIQILNEYERGVIFRLGKLLPQSERARRHPGLPADRPHGARHPAHGRARRAAAGHHHARQRVGEGERGRLLPRDRSASRGRRSRELHVRDVAAGADDAAERARAGGARRPAAERDRLNQQLQQILDQQTDPWGIKVSAVEVKHVDLPQDMQRAMARQAEAEREKRAKIIHAEGE